VVVALDPAGAPGDRRIGQAITAPEGSAASRLAGHVSGFGSIGGVALLALALAAVGWWCTHDARLAVLCVLAPGVAAVVQWLLKDLVQRRAPGDNAPAWALSFPSGHATGAWALAVAAAFVVRAVTAPGWIRRVGVGVVLTGALAVSVARVVTGDHYTTDVVAGALLGTSITLGCAALLGVTP
jgi:undecaprenyl-diphosphatase